MSIRLIIAAVTMALAAGSVGSWWLTSEYKDSKWQARITKINYAAIESLQAATARTMDIERQREKLANSLEVTHVESEKLLDEILADNQRLARELDGLRDYGARPDCRDPLPDIATTTGQPVDRAGGARLSEPATGFLLALTRDADRSAQYAKTCYLWIKQLHAEQERADRRLLPE